MSSTGSIDYNSSNGFQVSAWGPPLWHTLHIMSFNYSPERARRYADYFTSLEGVLPCGKCRDNFPHNIRDAGWLSYPEFDEDNVSEPFVSRENMGRFIYNLHNAVNVATGKPVHSQSFEQVRDKYEEFRASGCSKPSNARESGCHKSAHGTPVKCVLKMVPKSGDHVNVVASREPLGIRMKRLDGGEITVNDSVPGCGVGKGWTLHAIDGVTEPTWNGLRAALKQCRGGKKTCVLSFQPPDLHLA